MTSGILIAFNALPGFTPAFQAELSEYLEGQMRGSGAVDAGPVAASEDDEEPADLSVAQAKKVLERLSDKVRTTLRVIAEADASGFKASAVREALELDPDADLRGVWGGITRRVRSILGDDEAELIWWTDQDGDWIGWVSTMTHRSLRKALGL